MLRSTDLLALPAVDCDKAFAMQLSLEETLLTSQTVYFQVALLYPFCWVYDVNYTWDHGFDTSTQLLTPSGTCCFGLILLNSLNS